LILIIFVALVGMIFSVSAVHSYPVNVGDTIYLGNGPGNTGGGEFTVGKFIGEDLFRTFCMESNEFFYYNNPYIVGDISTEARNGGSGGPSPDPLDEKTAYLFYHFTIGDLSGYDYGAGRAGSADDLQRAIWFIEQENSGVYNYFVTLAENEISGGNWSGLGNVRVINLTDASGNLKQDQLILIPEPTTMLLLGFGLLGLGLARRKS